MVVVDSVLLPAVLIPHDQQLGMVDSCSPPEVHKYHHSRHSSEPAIHSNVVLIPLEIKQGMGYNQMYNLEMEVRE